MFSSALRSTLLALVASAVTVSAVPGLTLKLSGADKVDGIDNLKVVATLVNTGDETLKLLNDPRGPLSKLPTATFRVSHDESGVAPAFTGAKVCLVSPSSSKHQIDIAFRSSTSRRTLPSSVTPRTSPSSLPASRLTLSTIVSDTHNQTIAGR